jgi:subtilisin-like proprotein convertase family protein
MLAAFCGSAQTYGSAGSKAIAGNQQTTYDTINVGGLPQNMDGSFGLDSLKFNITYGYTNDLAISLISPNGTHVSICENIGNGADFTGTCITHSVTTLMKNMSAPFTGKMRPEGWLGAMNDGSSGNGNWILKIENTTNNTGTLLDWSLHFSNTPAPPAFFDSSLLPIMVVNTNYVVIPFYNDDKVNATMGIINNGVGNYNHLGDAFNDYDGHITIRSKGHSSRYFAQKPYKVETKDPAYANSVDVSLLGMPADNDWVLYAPYDDKTMIRNVLAYQLSNDMGHYASRTRMVELVLNGDYRGIYVLEEKIKRGADRVDIAKLKPEDTTGSQLTGGYIFSADYADVAGYDSWASNFLSCPNAATHVAFAYCYPKASDINAPQKAYIAAYVDSFENALYNYSLYDTVDGYRRYIDVPSFVDFAIQQELAHHSDAYRLSAYCYKQKDGKLFAGPMWDLNLAYGNSSIYGAPDVTSYMWNFPCPLNNPCLVPFWWKRLITDTLYSEELHCRYTNLRYNGALDTNHIMGIIDSLVNLLEVPQQQHYERWPFMGVHLFLNDFVGNSYDDEITWMKHFIRQRIYYLDQLWYNPACLDTATTTYTQALAAAGDVQLYPNPARDVLQLRANGRIGSLAIYNMMGQKVYEQAVNGSSCSIALKQRALPGGIYTLILHSAEGDTRRNFVLEE